MGGGKSNKVTGERALSHNPGSGGDSSQGIKQKKILKPNSTTKTASIDNHNSSGTKSNAGSAGVFYKMAKKASRKS